LAVGILGNAFSNLTAVDQGDDMIKAGASTSIYGLLGLIVGYCLINWPSL
jgi:hypothetical protein